MATRIARSGFTLLEMMAVVVLMGIVLAVAVDFYLDLSRASYAATTETGAARRAMVLLDRVARDLEGTVLLKKPADVDPLEFPWLFLAESESPDSGADRVKFVRRGRTPRSSDLPESDLEVVSWFVTEGPEGDLELRRASWPRLPDGLDRSFPDAEQSDLVTSGLASFGIRFQGEEGEWSGRWDSSTIAESAALPIAAEIEVSFETADEREPDGPYSRKVMLPLRPLALAEKLAEAAGLAVSDGEVKDEDGDGDIDEDDRAIAEEKAEQAENGGEEEGAGGVTVAECLALNPQLQGFLNTLPEEQQAVILGSQGQPATDFAALVGGLFPENCR